MWHAMAARVAAGETDHTDGLELCGHSSLVVEGVATTRAWFLVRLCLFYFHQVGRGSLVAAISQGRVGGGLEWRH